MWLSGGVDHPAGRETVLVAGEPVGPFPSPTISRPILWWSMSLRMATAPARTAATLVPPTSASACLAMSCLDHAKQNLVNAPSSWPRTH